MRQSGNDILVWTTGLIPMANTSYLYEVFLLDPDSHPTCMNRSYWYRLEFEQAWTLYISNTSLWAFERIYALEIRGLLLNYVNCFKLYSLYDFAFYSMYVNCNAMRRSPIPMLAREDLFLYHEFLPKDEQLKINFEFLWVIMYDTTQPISNIRLFLYHNHLARYKRHDTKHSD